MILGQPDTIEKKKLWISLLGKVVKKVIFKYNFMILIFFFNRVRLAYVIAFYITFNMQLHGIRGVSRTLTTSKIELLVKGWKSLTNDAKSSILYVTGVLDMLHHRFLSRIFSTGEEQIFLGQLGTVAVMHLWQKETVNRSNFSIVAGLWPATSQNKLCHN